MKLKSVRTLLLGLMLATLGGPPALAVTQVEYIDLRQLQNRPTAENVLKLFSAATDPVRQRVYVAGIMSTHIAILDSSTETWIGTIDTGVTGSYKYLSFDEVANRLYLHDGVNHKLYAINPATAAITGPISVPGSMAPLVVDSARGQIYMVSGEAPRFRALDGATLQTVYTNNEMSVGINQMAFDQANDRLYILDGAETIQGRIYRFDLATESVGATLSFPLDSGKRGRALEWDPGNRQLLLLMGSRVSVMNDSAQEQYSITLPVDREYQSMHFDAQHGQLAVLMLQNPADGTVAASGGHLQTYDTTTRQAVRDVSFGKKPHQIVYQSANGRYYVPEGDASVVSSISAESGAVTSLRMGDSAEQVLLARGGDSVYVSSRLGGSYMAEFQRDTRTLQAFGDGTWPLPMRVDSSGDYMLVLNSWDSSISLFELNPSRSLLATFGIGLPIGSTDRLPDLAVDGVRKRAYAAYPEFGRIAVVDWLNRTPLTTVTLAGFIGGDTGGGPGQLQVMVNETAARLFAFVPNSRKLTVFDISAAVPLLLSERTLSDLPSNDAGFDLMFLDAAQNRLFVGPLELNATTGASTGRKLTRGDRIFGIDTGNNAYWASAVEASDGQNYEVVISLSSSDLSVSESSSIAPAAGQKLQYAFDGTRQLIYAADLAQAKVTVYSSNGRFRNGFEVD